VPLIADRFAALDDGRVIDLATGDAVTLITSTAGGHSDQLRWTAWCDRMCRLHHRSIATLADFGLVGETTRFEAWHCGAPWSGSAALAEQTRSRAASLLRAEALAAVPLASDSLCTWRDRPVVLPRDRIVGDAPEPAALERCSLDACGLATIERGAVAAVAEMLDQIRGPAATIIALRVAGTGGVSVALRQVARIARQRGFVPVGDAASTAIGPQLAELVAGRTLLLIDRRDGSSGLRRVLAAALANPRAHVLLQVAPDHPAFGSALRLDPVPTEALVAAIRPANVDASARRRIERLAEAARGCPARLARMLWGGESLAAEGVARSRSVAAEPSAVYKTTADTAPVAADWSERLKAAIALLEAGRHAPGERAVRAAVGGLSRRMAWDAAAHGQLALAWSLIRRGRPREALATLEAAGESAGRAGGSTLVLVAAATGHARFDDGRLDDAESTLTAAVEVCRSVDDMQARLTCAVALARCLFWRGRYDAARAVLDGVRAPAATDAAVRLDILQSRIALGRGDLTAAVSHAAAAMAGGEASGGPSIMAHAAQAAALAHLRVGDLAAMDRDVAAALQAARAARDPLQMLTTRLLGAAGRIRPDDRGALHRLLAHTSRVTLPWTVRARAAYVADLLAEPAGPSTIERHATTTRLPALALFRAAEAEAGAGLPIGVDVLVDLLDLCQSAETDAAVLPGICAQVRERLRAAAAALFVGEPGAPYQIAADGGRIETAIAARVVDVRQAVAPHQRTDRIEAGVPVRYGGELLGALVARWTIAAPPVDASRAMAILTMTAAAAGPAVAAARARRQSVAAPALAELLGVSTAMAEVRAAVERAAPAPFAVLVEGESGSGKELVARALHRRGPRRDRPFCAVNCAALADDLVDAELFGHTRGAFTGAVADRPGVFEEAHTGTLFLDEIGELSPRAQAKILRTLQENEVRRVGDNLARRVDVRVVSATNRELRQEVAAGRFRLDLLYRLDVIRIVIPPLRDRRDDIPLLAEHFWRDATARLGSRAILGAQIVAALARYDWPGNVRELQNVLASLAVRGPKRGVVPTAALPPPLAAAPAPGVWKLDEARRTFEERFVRAALVRTGGHRARAAQELGVSRQGLAKLMSRLHITD
jgi:transcriptional regulator with GAF, ATPase, and Fis domain